MRVARAGVPGASLGLGSDHDLWARPAGHATASPPILARRFFPTVVHLASSKLCVAVMGNMAFALELLVVKGIIRVRCRDRGGCSPAARAVRVPQAVISSATPRCSCSWASCGAQRWSA